MLRPWVFIFESFFLRLAFKTANVAHFTVINILIRFADKPFFILDNFKLYEEELLLQKKGEGVFGISVAIFSKKGKKELIK